MRTRFAPMPAPAARLLLAGLAALVALGLAGGPAPGPRLGPAEAGDAALYRAVAARSDTPAAYYAAATAEQRARGYPLQPFVTVREPALALVTHRLGAVATGRAYALLAIAVAVACLFGFRAVPGRPERIAATGLSSFAVLLLAQPALASWHEAWAGLLLAAAAAAGGGGRRGWTAGALGLAALLVRELALPGAVALAALALVGRRRGEAAGWAAALALFAVALGAHALAVGGHLRPGDPASPGWARFGGWGTVLAMVRGASLFALLPRPLVAVAVPLALLGWAAPGTRFSDRAAAVLAATLLPFTVVGRPDNVYWGLIAAPLLPAGLAFAPAALADLARQAGRQTPSVRAWPGTASS